MSDLLTGKTVLVTGATGFIGGHLLRRLRNSRVIALTRRQDSAMPPDVTVVQCSLDALTEQTWRDAGIDQIDYVFHLGAFTPKTKNDANQVEAICRDNIEGTRALLRSLPHGLDRIVFASTLDVYAPSAYSAPITEHSAVGPTGLYGASKLFCERLVTVMARERGWSAVILRYGHIFGPGEEAYAKLIPEMIRNLLRGDAPTIYGDGSTERDYLYVSDAVEATMRAAIAYVGNDCPINIVRGASVPIREIAETLIRIMAASVQPNYLAELPAGPSFRFHNVCMRAVLGEWPLVSLKEGLQEEVDDVMRAMNRDGE